MPSTGSAFQTVICLRARAVSLLVPTTLSMSTSSLRGRRVGPKGVLEAMATGVPLVTTRVGQAQDLVEDGRNGFLVDVEDAGAIAEAVLRVHGDWELALAMTSAGRVTAEQHAYEHLDRDWEQLLDGFVVREGRHESH